MSNLCNVTAVMPVSDHAASVAWYTKWLGRDPDVASTEGVAEWRIADNAWIQAAQVPDPALAGKSGVVIGVADIDVQLSTLSGAGVQTDDVTDYGFIRLTEVTDPDGNKIKFAWENPNYDPTAG